METNKIYKHERGLFIKTNIPPIILSQILQTKSFPETIAVLLNEAEERYLPSPKHWCSKRVYPFWKVCRICQKPFPTFTKAQTTRNETCSLKCKSELIFERKFGKSAKRAMTEITCPVCGKKVLKPNAWLKKVKTPTCSRRCNGVLRGQEWKTYAHLGRAGWSEETKKGYKIKVSGENNPAWKGGVTYFKTHGNYVGVKYVRCPEKFRAMARKDGYVMEHRLIVAQHVGRCLTRTEVVHHKDHVPSNNDPHNLSLFKNNQDHKKYEATGQPEPLWQM